MTDDRPPVKNVRWRVVVMTSQQIFRYGHGNDLCPKECQKDSFVCFVECVILIHFKSRLFP